MERFRNTLILLLLAGIPAAAPSFFAASAPKLCFTAGSVTYQVASARPDIRVRVDAAHPDLRIRLVDDVASADFALVDDIGAPGACESAGLLKTVQLIGDSGPADIVMSLSPSEGDLKLYVHSARFGHREAAALFAAMRYQQDRATLAQAR